jgi:hypothetical protein
MGHDTSRVVALWKDPARGIREIPLEPGVQAVLLSACTDRIAKHSIDGRHPLENGTQAFDVGVRQITAANEGMRSAESRPVALSAPALGTLEISILTGWAEALADCLAYAPARAEEVIAQARPGARWRPDAGIGEPSPELTDGIVSLDRAVSAARTAGASATLEAVLEVTCNEPADAKPIDRLAWAVMRSTLEQRRTRHVPRPDQARG